MNTARAKDSKLRQGLDEVIAALATVALRALFLPEPTWAPNEERKRAFDALFLKAFSLGLDEPIDYTLPYPRHEFLRYLVTQQDVVLFGSNSPSITVLEPRAQNDSSGQRLRGVFASGDGIWPIFNAILDQELYQGSVRSAAFVVKITRAQERRYYYFSLNEKLHLLKPWRGPLSSRFRKAWCGTMSGFAPIRCARLQKLPSRHRISPSCIKSPPTWRGRRCGVPG